MKIKDFLKKLFIEDYGLIFVSLGGLFSTVLGAFFWFIFATILNVDNYGLVNFYFAIATIFAGIGTIGLNVTITTFLAKGDRKLLYQANSLILFTAPIVALILSIFHWISGLLSIAIIFSAMSIAELFGKKLYMEYSFAAVGQRIAQIIIGILFYFQFGLMGILFGYFLGTLLFSYRYFLNLKNFTTTVSVLKEKRNFILHNYGYELIGETLSNNLDKVIIGTIFGYFTLGLYQLGFQFFMFLNIIPIILAQYLLPEESSGNQKNQIKIIGIIVSIVFSIVMFFFSPYLIERFFPSFLEAIPLIQTITITVIPATIVAITKTALLCKEKTKPVFLSSIIYLISFVLSIIALGTILGITGLALAILSSKTIQATYLCIQK